MYSVVLATMLTAGSATPAWHHHNHGCNGCYSSCYSGYSGYGGYSGYSCHSCYSSYSYCGCCSYSSCHYPVFHRFHHFTPMTPPCSCYCSSYYSSCYCSSYCCSSGVTVVPVPPDTKKKGEKVPVPKEKESEVSTEPSTPQIATSRVTVTLPSDARLWVDNVECPLTSSQRSFTTPALDPNHLYTYNFRMEVVRNGRAVSQQQRVVIVPGQPVQVNFNGDAVVSR